MQIKEKVHHLSSIRVDLPRVKIPVGIYGKELDPEEEQLYRQLIDYGDASETQIERNSLKIERCKKLLGTWWRLHRNSTFVNRGEYFLSIYHRQILNKKPDISLFSGKHMLVSELRDLINNLDPRRRLYIGDLKLMGD